MQEDDHLLRDALSNLAPTVDGGGVWKTLCARASRRRRARRRLRLAVTIAVVVVALGLGALGTIHWWPQHERILLITDDQTGGTTSETAQAATQPSVGWQQLSLPQSGNPYFSYVMMDPTDPDVLYSGTDVGLFVSRDAGSSWTRLSVEKLETLAIDPSPPSTLYGVTRDENGDARLQKSVDGGTTWEQLDGLQEGFQGRLWLDTSASPSIIYVNNLSEPYGLLKSTDGGDTWKGLGVGPNCELVSPPSGSVLYAQRSTGGPLEFLRSADGGATWENMGGTFSDAVPMGMNSDPRDPSRRLYLYAADPALAMGSITDPGIVVFVSPDGGRTWSRADSAEQEWAKILPFVAPGTPPASISAAAPFLAGFAAISEAAPSLDGNPPTVTDSATGASLYVSGPSPVVVDPSNPSILYVAANASLGTGGIYKSTDQGATWTNTTAAIKTDAHVSSLIVDPTNPDTIYVTARIRPSVHGHRSLMDHIAGGLGGRRTPGRGALGALYALRPHSDRAIPE